MKKIVLLCIITFQLLAGTVFAAEAPFTPKKIAILNLENATVYPQLGNLASAAIMVHLLKTSSCEIMDQDVLNQAFLQQGQDPNGIIPPDIVSAVGAKLNLDYVIMGSVGSATSYYRAGYWRQTKYGPQYTPPSASCSAAFNIMMIDVQTSKIIWHESFPGASNSTTELQAAMEDGGYQTARRIYPFIPLLGSITQAEGNKFHINLSHANGIRAGDLFSPADSAPPSSDKKKKAAPSIVLKVVEVGDTDCVAVLTKGKAADIQPGTTVSKHFRTSKGLFGIRKAESLKQNSD